jgi:transposase-like protein
MTARDVVAQVRDGRLEDFVREAVVLVARELTDAEISAQIGAELSEVAPESQVTHRNFAVVLEALRQWGEHPEGRPAGRPAGDRGPDQGPGVLYHSRRNQPGLVAAAVREVFNAEDRDQARERVSHVIGRLEQVAPRVCRMLEDAEENLIAAREHRTKLRSTNPLERVNNEIGRRTDVVVIFPNDAAVIRLAGALLSEQNDESLVQRRNLSVKSMALILSAGSTEENSPKQEHQQQRQEAAQLNDA